MIREISTVELVEGGNIIRQGEFFRLDYLPRDANGNPVDLTNKDITVAIMKSGQIVYEKDVEFDPGDGLIHLVVNENIGNGRMWLEFTATDPNFPTYRRKFPSRQETAVLDIVPGAEDLDFVGVSGMTVEKLQAEQASRQQEFEAEIVPQVEEFKQRVEDGIGAFTEDTEVLDARGGEVNLGTRLNKVTAQLAETTVKIDLSKRQSILYGQFFQKLRKGESVTIVGMGDSMMYGHDSASSDVRPPDPTVLPNGSTHSVTRASKTLTEALSESLNEVYPDKVSVINRGFSGDGTRAAYSRWITTANSDLTIINFGINDSRASWVPYAGDIEEFVHWYEQLIIREIGRNSAVVMLTPPKAKSATELNVDVFSNAIISLANKYSIPLIDSEEFLSNQSHDIYSDATHLNGVGYTIYGKRLASLFIGEGMAKPRIVSSGTRLLTRPAIDNVVLKQASMLSATSAFTPSETKQGEGISVALGNGGAIYYSFFVENEDTIVIPSVRVTRGTGGTPIVTYELDFGAKQGDFSMDYLSGSPEDFTTVAASTIASSVTKTLWHNYLKADKVADPDYVKLHITTRGWHTLKISHNSNGSTGNFCFVHGLEFLNYRTYENTVKLFSL